MLYVALALFSGVLGFLCGAAGEYTLGTALLFFCGAATMVAIYHDSKDRAP
jgi:hypothetical protein